MTGRPPEPDQSGSDKQPGEGARAIAVYGRNFWLVFAASMALNSAANLFVLFPLFILGLGGGASSVGAIVGTGSLAALLARPGVGFAIDRRGRRWTALRFLALDAVAIALYLPIKSLGWPIYAVRMLHGAIEGTARVALFAMVYDLLPEGRQGQGMSIFSLCGMGPAAIVPFLGEVIISHAGFHAFFLTAVALVAAGALATTALPDERTPNPDASDEAKDTPDAPGYMDMLSRRRLRTLWVAALFFSLAISSRLSFLAPIAYARGIRDVGAYFAIYSVTAVTARLTTGRLIDRIGLARLIAPSMAVLGLGLGLVALTGHPGVLEVAAFIGGLGHGYLYPSLSGLVITRTTQNAMGRSSTIYTSINDFGLMAGPYLLGVVGGYLGYGAVFVTAGMFAVVGASFFLVAEPASLKRRLA